MQDLFESELADGLEDDGDGFEDEFENTDMGEDPLEDAFADEGEDRFEDDSFEEDALGDDGFEDDALDEAESLSADAFEDDSFEEDGLDAADEDEFDEFAEGDGDGADEGDALDDAFAEAMDAADDDEFARRLSSRFSRLRRIARPYLRQMAKRAVPIGLRLIRYVARHGGGGPSRLDAMDAFADAAADEAIAGRSAHTYIPFLAGLAGRYVTKAILRASRGSGGRGAARAFGRAVTKATREAAHNLVRKRGPKALRSIPRIVRKVAKVARKRRGSAKAVPRMIHRATRLVAASPRAVVRLSRPSPAVKRARALAGVGSSAPVIDRDGMKRRRRRSRMEQRRAL